MLWGTGTCSGSLLLNLTTWEQKRQDTRQFSDRLSCDFHNFSSKSGFPPTPDILTDWWSKRRYNLVSRSVNIPWQYPEPGISYWYVTSNHSKRIFCVWSQQQNTTKHLLVKHLSCFYHIQDCPPGAAYLSFQPQHNFKEPQPCYSVKNRVQLKMDTMCVYRFGNLDASRWL